MRVALERGGGIAPHDYRTTGGYTSAYVACVAVCWPCSQGSASPSAIGWRLFSLHRSVSKAWPSRLRSHHEARDA